MTIHLDEPGATYSTLDEISGKVTVTATSNTRFEDIQIQFLGASKAFVARMHTAPGMGKTPSAFHTFLKLTQPIPETSYPHPRILEAGRTYTFPFLFVVPSRLLPRICRHAVQHESVQDLHLQLPPTLGGHGNHDGSTQHKDDFAPDMAQISYHVAARLQGYCNSSGSMKTLALQSKPVNVLPSFDEQPPVNVEGPDNDYHLRREKGIKKGLFKGSLGTLVAEAAQPKSLRLPVGYTGSTIPVSTAVKIKLRFDPSSAGIAPPKLSSLSTRIRVSTWFADTPRSIIPNKKRIMYDIHQGVHSETLSLSSRSMENVEWSFRKHEWSASLDRRDSGLSDFFSSSSCCSPSERYRGDGFYTAEIFAPITLPTNRHFSPTFHSCLISRTYTLYLQLSAQGGALSAPSVELKVPVQLSSEGKPDAEGSRSSGSLTVVEQIEEELSADDLFNLRTTSSLGEVLVDNSAVPGITTSTSSDLPPEYEPFGQGRRIRLTA